MTTRKPSSKKAKKFAIKGKDEIKGGEPVVSDEFFLPDVPEGELNQGQTITVEADTKFSDDKGTGEPVIIRTFEFIANPEVFIQYERFANRLPTAQELFDNHKQGIAAQLWGDGLTPHVGVEPKLVFSKDKTRYLITVAAVPMLGHTLSVNTQTLSEVFNPHGQNTRTQSSKDTV